MGKKPTNLTLNQTVLERAETLMTRRGYDSLSGLVEQLIRDEYDRRYEELREDRPAHPPLEPPERVSYLKKKAPDPKPTEAQPRLPEKSYEETL